jgi:hypothetical protein
LPLLNMPPTVSLVSAGSASTNRWRHTFHIDTFADRLVLIMLSPEEEAKTKSSSDECDDSQKENGVYDESCLSALDQASQ